MKSLLVSVAVTFVATGLQGADWRPVDPDGSAAKIYAALEQKTTIEFIETPLQDVIDYLEELHGIETDIDWRVIHDTGVGSDTPVTANLKNVSLKNALSIVLREMKFAYVVRDDVLLITTEAESERLVVTQVYDVEPLIHADHKIDELARAVTDALGRRYKMPPTDAKEIVGGRPPKQLDRGLATYRNFLIITDSDAGHRHVQRLLGLLGAGLQTRPENGIR